MNLPAGVFGFITSHATQFIDSSVAGGSAFLFGLYVRKVNMRNIIFDCMVCILIVIESLNVLIGFHIKGIWADVISLVVGVIGRGIITSALAQIVKHKSSQKRVQ